MKGLALATLPLLLGCASTVGHYSDGAAEAPSVDAFDATADVDSDLEDRVALADGDVSAQPDSPTGDAVCTAPSFRPCVSSNKECGACGLCTLFGATTAPEGRVVAGERVCLTTNGRSCNAGGYVSDCDTDAVCPTTYGSSSPAQCIRTEECLEYERRFYARYPSAVPPVLPHCWYSDGTRVAAGRRASARCIRSSLQTCGVGCPCAEGLVCNWASERSPTGVCLPPYFPSLQSRPCFRPPRQWNCRDNNACLLPLRGTVDGVRDNDRAGRCVPREACLEAQRLLGDAYLCLTSPAP